MKKSSKEIIWKVNDNKVVQLEKKLKIPSLTLQNVPRINLISENDFDKLPTSGGCYWIWTNEPVYHSLHQRPTPKSFNDGEIIYNGYAQDNLQNRIRQHLISDFNAGWSGISMDIYTKSSKSHRKKAMSEKPRAKVPFLNTVERINNVKLLLRLFLSKEEKKFLKAKNRRIAYFRNGINIFENKHANFLFKVYFLTGFKSKSYAEFIEKKWRENHNSPKLCSYISGR